MPVQMELKRIIISEIHEQQVIMLREVEGERSFSIMIGIFEATIVALKMKSPKYRAKPVRSSDSRMRSIWLEDATQDGIASRGSISASPGIGRSSLRNSA